jgi:hypothetical protein
MLFFLLAHIPMDLFLLTHVRFFCSITACYFIILYDFFFFFLLDLIDGGTHFKKKYAVKETQGDTKFSICSSIRGRLMCEAPGNRSEDFKATLSLDGHPRVASLDYRCFVAQGL